MNKEELITVYKATLYNYDITPKEKREKLRTLESQLAQFADIKTGTVFYTSWGYDQTQNDFLKVVEVSPTKKTILCRMVGKHLKADYVTADLASPNTEYESPVLFRLRVSWFSDGATLRGSYPFCENDWLMCKLADSERSKAYFECPKIDCTQEKNFFYWNNDRRRTYCEGCEHCYVKHEASYREGSFSIYEKPLYETAIGFGH